ncbi:MAG TPA: nucleotidyltransferase domain-containing protein [candidate division Zixibacteria bacterium]|nr:nucleotidyltransferase domain-containing protein [candidate division Zixibacteria bacterium]
MKYDDLFTDFLIQAKSDPNILGVILLGSRGKGFYKEHSDYDFQVIVREEVLEEYKDKIKEIDNQDFFDCSVLTLESFKNYAAWDTEFMWDRYTYANVKPLIDKTNGVLEQIIVDKGGIPQEHIKDFTAGTLDAYINSVYRSMKGLRDKNIIAYRLEAVDSINYLLQVLFAIHDGRLRPYNKYLKIELEKYPLKKLKWTSDEFLQMPMRIIETGDYKIQQKIMIEVQAIMQKEGFGYVFDSWEGNEKWTMSFEPK